MNNPLWYGKGSGSFADAVARMLSPGYFDSWETFASTVHNSPTAPTATNFMSLEYIHNIVHVSKVLFHALTYTNGLYRTQQEEHI
jgi:hypothetical protein